MDHQLLIGEEITFVERLITEELTMAMERILDAHGVSCTTPSKAKDPWMTSIVDDPYHYHTEVQLSGDKIKSYSCNCNVYQSGQLCAHICASLVQIRSTRTAAQTSKPKRASRGVSLLKKVLSQLSHSDLEYLVKDFAQRDDTTRLILYGRYYTLLSREEQKGLIERSFPAMTRVDQRIGQKYISSFIAFSSEILTTHSSLLAEEDYVAAYKMLFPVLKKSFYIKSHLQKENNRILDNHSRLIDRFLEMTVLVDAPDLRHAMNDQLLELLSSSYISANTPAEQKIWLYIHLWPEPRARLDSIIRQMIAKGKGEDVDTYYFAQTLLLLISEDRQSMIREMDSQSRYRAIQYLLQLSRVEAVPELLREFVICSHINSALLRQVLDRLTPLADSMMDRLMEVYRDGRDAYVLRWLQQHCTDRDRLNDVIREDADRSGDVQIMLDYLILTEQHGEAALLLAEQRSTQLLRRYDHQLYPSQKAALLRMYKDVCGEYIQDHFGSSSRDYLIDIYQHLRVIGADDILKKLQAHIKEEFKNRRSLKVE